MTRKVSRREFIQKAGTGLGALAAGRFMLGSAARAAGSSGEALQVAWARPGTALQAAALARFDDTHARPAPGIAELLLWPGDRDRLDALGIPYRIMVQDLVAHDLAADAGAPAAPDVSAPGPPRTAYRRLAEYEADLKSLAATYPDLARLIELPEPTLEGRKVYGIEIASDVARQDGRPVFYMDGIHHAREWPAAEMVMMFAWDLLETYGTDPRVTSIVDGVRTILVPVQNPDGFNHSRESAVDQSLLGGVAGGQEGYWRKNRRSFTGLTVPVVQKNPDAYGTDPNRNYAFEWGDNEGGSSGSQLDATYRGTAPFAEPECRNVRGIILGRAVTAMISHHTYGRLVLRPWGHTFDDPPDEAILKSLGDQMGAITKYRSQKGLSLYATTGTTDDWAYAATGSLGYTFEHGTAFHPAYSSTIAAMYNTNRPAFLLLAEAAGNPSYHSVLRGRAVDAAGQPVAAELAIDKEFHTRLWKSGDGSNPTGQKSIREVIHLETAAGPDGTFSWHLNPSTRPTEIEAGRTESYRVTITAAGGGTRSVDVVLRRGEALDLGDVVL
ncbi:MAG TPA: M14 family metallopeptidase [Actinomycetota bacterium]|nr:M14 family metallopeptidase [Actinomycetota bacterium]